VDGLLVILVALDVLEVYVQWLQVGDGLNDFGIDIVVIENCASGKLWGLL